MCRKALEIAERADERELALDVLKRCPSAESIELASSLVDDEEVREQAVETAIFIGEKIKDKDPAAASGRRKSARSVAAAASLPIAPGADAPDPRIRFNAPLAPVNDRRLKIAYRITHGDCRTSSSKQDKATTSAIS